MNKSLLCVLMGLVALQLATSNVHAQTRKSWDFRNGFSEATIAALASDMNEFGAEKYWRNYENDSTMADEQHFWCASKDAKNADGYACTHNGGQEKVISELEGLTLGFTAAKKFVVTYNGATYPNEFESEGGPALGEPIPHGNSYVWLNGKQETIKFHAAVNQTIKIGVESHAVNSTKLGDARGISLSTSTGSLELTKGNPVTTYYTECEWELIGDEGAVAELTIQSTNGCHIYYIIVGDGVDIPEPEPYAVLSDDSLTVTFYYDDQKSARGGIDINNSYISSDSSSPYGTATTAVIDASFANYRPTSTAYWFQNCNSLATITGMENLNTANVTSMGGMFEGCSGLTSLDVSNFNTQNVTYMESMFYGCSGLTSLDVSNFNTQNVTNMGSMFYGCSGLMTIFAGSDWSTAAVTSGNGMFDGCRALVGSSGTTYDANHLDAEYARIDGGTANPGYFTDKNAPVVTEPEAYALLTDNADVVSSNENGTVYGKTLTFYYDEKKAENNGMGIGPHYDFRAREWYDAIEYITTVVFDDSFANYGNLTSTYDWFNDCSNLSKVEGISNLRTDSVTDMTGMFGGCSSLTSLDVSHFNTAKVVGMYGMFSGCSGLTTLDVSNFNTSSVTDMRYMFHACSGLTVLDLSNFNTVNVTSMDNIFANCSNLQTIYVSDGWTMDNVTSTGNMFIGCTNLVGGNGTTYDANNVSYMYARIDQGASAPGYFTPKNGYDINATFDGLVLTVGENTTMPAAMEYVGGREVVAATVAAVVWNNNEAISNSDMQGLTDNPNLLLYVANKALAPGNVKNIVVGDSVNGYKALQIVLTETESGNGNFYCPIAFTANRITYEREFLQQTEPDSCRGWETITLPFQPQSIMHERYGQISPFAAAGDSRPFWLRELTSNGFQDAQRIEANRPYIISMPNYSGYDAEYQLGGRVSFSGYNCQVPQTRLQTAADSTGAIRFIPVLSSVEQGDSVYALNVGEEYLVDGKRYAEGSVFARGLEGVRPFHCYTQHAASTPAPRYMPIAGWILGDVTDIKMVQGEGLKVNGEYYNLNGQRVQNPKKGLYITHGKKVVVNW